MNLCAAPGLWKYAGLTGVLTGLDWSAALTLASTMRPDADPDMTIRYLRAAESGMAEAAARKAAEKN